MCYKFDTKLGALEFVTFQNIYGAFYQIFNEARRCFYGRDRVWIEGWPPLGVEEVIFQQISIAKAARLSHCGVHHGVDGYLGCAERSVSVASQDFDAFGGTAMKEETIIGAELQTVNYGHVTILYDFANNGIK